jgi:uncharacterized protein (TIGR02646 family)
MLKIIKGKTPKDLEDYQKELVPKKQSTADYEKFRNLNYEDRQKEDQPFKLLQKALLEEQQYLCCYCMKKIDMSRVSVEHFIEKSSREGANLSVEYSNLLGSCDSQNSCNIGRNDLKIEHLPNPADNNTNVEDIISYNSKGEVCISTTYQGLITQEALTSLLCDINNRLKLNNETLRKSRIEKYLSTTNAIKDALKRKGNTETKENFLKILESKKPIDYYGYLRFHFRTSEKLK